MIQINQEGESHIVVMSDDQVIIDGVRYPKPGNGNSLIQISGRIIVNGYEFVDGRFRRTFFSFMNSIF